MKCDRKSLGFPPRAFRSFDLGKQSLETNFPSEYPTGRAVNRLSSLETLPILVRHNRYFSSTPVCHGQGSKVLISWCYEHAVHHDSTAVLEVPK